MVPITFSCLLLSVKQLIESIILVKHLAAKKSSHCLDTAVTRGYYGSIVHKVCRCIV